MIKIEPTVGNFAACGGCSVHQIFSESATRMAFKVKTSNNDHYRINPVYGFIDAKGKVTMEINRLDGPPKEDKCVVQYAEVPQGETDPKAPFKAEAQQGEVIFKMIAL